MPSNRATMVEEDSDDLELDAEILNERYLNVETERLLTKDDDPFTSVPKSLLSKNQKRKIDRLQKRFTGAGAVTDSAGFVSQISSSSLNAFLPIKNPQTKGGAKAKYITPEQVFNGYFIWHLAPPPFNLNYLTELSLANPTHSACIDAKATNIVGLGYHWEETTKVRLTRADIEKDDAKITKLAKKLARTNDNLTEWIESLNNIDTFTDTMLKVWKDVEATGNGYIEIGRNNNGSIGYVGHIPAYTMRVRVERDGFIQLLPTMMNKVIFFKNYGDKTTKDLFGNDPSPNEVIHIKKEHPRSSYYGIPCIIAGLPAIAGDKFAVEYNLEYFENKAVPRYALIVKGAKLSAESEKKILEYFRKEVKGNHHGTLYIPIPSGAGKDVDVKLEPIENQMQESSFHQYREDNRVDILMVHRTPPTIVALEMSNLASSREAMKVYKDQVCRPEQGRVEIRLNRIIKEITDIFILEFDEYDLVDEETQSRIDDRYIRNGVINPNEVRPKIGLQPRKGGDKYLDPSIKPGGDPVAGPPKKTAEGSAKNPSSNRTPSKSTPTGRKTNGTLQDQGTGTNNK